MRVRPLADIACAHPVRQGDHRLRSVLQGAHVRWEGTDQLHDEGEVIIIATISVAIVAGALRFEQEFAHEEFEDDACDAPDVDGGAVSCT